MFKRLHSTQHSRLACVGMLAVALLAGGMLGCEGGTGTSRKNVYSWKPKAATQPHRARATARPEPIRSNMAGEDVLADSHRAATATWVAVPTPDGKKMRWVQMK